MCSCWRQREFQSSQMTATVTDEVWIAKGNIRREHPLLRIRGKWMDAAGFSRGTKVVVELDGDKLVITKQKEQNK